MFTQLLLGPAHPTEEGEGGGQASLTYDEVLSMLVALLAQRLLSPQLGGPAGTCLGSSEGPARTKGSQPSGLLLLALPTQQAAC